MGHFQIQFLTWFYPIWQVKSIFSSSSIVSSSVKICSLVLHHLWFARGPWWCLCKPPRAGARRPPRDLRCTFHTFGSRTRDDRQEKISNNPRKKCWKSQRLRGQAGWRAGAGFDEDHIGPGHYTYLTRPFWSWFVPDASNKSANGVTRIFGQDLSFLDEWVESLARTNHTSKYGADIIVNFWQHLEGGRASGLRRRRHLWKSRCCSASDEHSSIYHW